MTKFVHGSFKTVNRAAGMFHKNGTVLNSTQIREYIMLGIFTFLLIHEHDLYKYGKLFILKKSVKYAFFLKKKYIKTA